VRADSFAIVSGFLNCSSFLFSRLPFPRKFFARFCGFLFNNNLRHPLEVFGFVSPDRTPLQPVVGLFPCSGGSRFFNPHPFGRVVFLLFVVCPGSPHLRSLLFLTFSVNGLVMSLAFFREQTFLFEPSLHLFCPCQLSSSCTDRPKILDSEGPPILIGEVLLSEESNLDSCLLSILPLFVRSLQLPKVFLCFRNSLCQISFYLFFLLLLVVPPPGLSLPLLRSRSTPKVESSVSQFPDSAPISHLPCWKSPTQKIKGPTSEGSPSV